MYRPPPHYGGLLKVPECEENGGEGVTGYCGGVLFMTKTTGPCLCRKQIARPPAPPPLHRAYFGGVGGGGEGGGHGQRALVYVKNNSPALSLRGFQVTNIFRSGKRTNYPPAPPSPTASEEEGGGRDRGMWWRRGGCHVLLLRRTLSFSAWPMRDHIMTEGRDHITNLATRPT